MKCIIKELGLLEQINISYFCGQCRISRTQFYNIINNVKVPRLDTAYAITYLMYMGKIIDRNEISELFIPEWLYNERYGED